MARYISTMVSVLIGVAAFLTVVLWPSKSHYDPTREEQPEPELAELGLVTEPPTATTPVSTRRAEAKPSTRKVPSWHRPRTPARREERHRMARRQIAEPRDGRQAVSDPHVLAAMRHVPRHEFVKPSDARAAYADHPLPIGYGQTISQPYIVAMMTEALLLEPGEKVLEIGTGSGYQAAVLSELTPHVFTIEILEPLADLAKARFQKLGYKTIQSKQGDGYFGWGEHAPFDAIIVTCAAGHVPPPLFQQLAPGGRMVVPIGQPGMYQQLKLITKDAKTGRPRYKTLCGVAFVPMTGRIQQ